MNKSTLLLILVGMAVILAACTAGPNQLRNTPDEDGDVAGFWSGVWHGLISPVTFILSLFSKAICWYTFGFLVGASMTFGGSGGGAACRRKRRG